MGAGTGSKQPLEVGDDSRIYMRRGGEPESKPKKRLCKTLQDDE